MDRLELTSGTLNQGANLIANNEISLSVTDKVINTGRLKTLDKLNLTVYSLINNGSLVSDGNLEINAQDEIKNSALVYSRGNSTFYLSGKLLNDGGEIISKGNLTVQKIQI